MINITLSGLDEYGTFGFRDALKRGQFEKHEVAILYSEKRMGKEPRYPDQKMIDRLIQLPNVSLHLCGRVVYDLIEGKISPRVAFLVETVDRVQLNISRTHWIPINVAANLHAVNSDIQWIIQFADDNDSIERCQELVRLMKRKPPHFLLDASGGRGIGRKDWRKIDLPNMGAAGGLNPDNVKDQLILMQEQDYLKDEFWVDTESGIRTDDQWDWDKARRFIEAVEEFQNVKAS